MQATLVMVKAKYELINLFISGWVDYKHITFKRLVKDRNFNYSTSMIHFQCSHTSFFSVGFISSNFSDLCGVLAIEEGMQLRLSTLRS